MNNHSLHEDEGVVVLILNMGFETPAYFWARGSSATIQARVQTACKMHLREQVLPLNHHPFSQPYSLVLCNLYTQPDMNGFQRQVERVCETQPGSNVPLPSMVFPTVTISAFPLLSLKRPVSSGESINFRSSFSYMALFSRDFEKLYPCVVIRTVCWLVND